MMIMTILKKAMETVTELIPETEVSLCYWLCGST